MKKNEYYISIVTKIAVILCSFLSQTILARFLGASIKGEVSYIQNLVGIFSIICAFGLHHSYPYFRKNESFTASQRDDFISAVLLLFMFYLLLLFIVFIIQKNLTNLLIFLFSILLGYSNIVSYIFLIESPNRKNVSNLFFSVIELFMFLLTTFLCTPTSLLGIILVFFCESTKGIYYTAIIKPKLSITFDSFLLLTKQLKFGFLPMISLLLTNLNYKLDIIMLKNANISSFQIGVYSVAISVAEKSLLLSDSLKEILISKLSKGYGISEVTKINRISFTLTLVLCLLISIFCKPFIYIFFGEEYIGSINLIRIIVFSTLFMVFFKTVGSYNIVNNKQKLNTFALSISVVSNFISNIILIPIFGVIGAAFSTVLSFVVCGTLFLLQFCYKNKINIKEMVIVNVDDLKNIINIIGGRCENNNNS